LKYIKLDETETFTMSDEKQEKQRYLFILRSCNTSV